MSEKITVILTRANWCIHCQHFEPIFTLSEKDWKNNKYLKDFNLEFKNYDMANDDEKNIFMLEHFNALEKIKGYPTVVININDGKSSKYLLIDHTVIDTNVNKDKQDADASDRFFKNISNAIKSKNSDNKVLYLQTGGSPIYNNQTPIKESIYRNKYLKYKSKYFELKNKF